MNADADLSPRAVATVVLDFMAALDLTDVTLVGNDTGGAICQFLLDTDHSRIGRLVLTNCDAFDNFPPKPFDLLFKVGRSRAMLKVLLASMRPTFLRHSALGFGLLLNGKPDAAVTRSWIEPCASDRLIRRDTAKVMKAIKPADLLDVSTRLSNFSKPVQLVWGDADRMFKISFAERLADAFPDATLTRVPGGRTFIPLEEPEQVASAIAAMVDATR
jgi:pimeloyl-ACP methyl ester carboxylesterase